MYDHYEHQQDEYYRKLKEKRVKTKRILNGLGKSAIYLLLGNAFALVIYDVFIAKLVSDKILNDQPVAGVVCTFSIIAQVIVLLIVCALLYTKDTVEHRALLDASHQVSFDPLGYYIATWKRFGWMLPATYFVLQLPFMLYYAILGYFYEAETTFAQFYIPQLSLCEWTGSGFLGVILNTLLLVLMWGACIFLCQRAWLRGRIRT
jgi:hypothetical protein